MPLNIVYLHAHDAGRYVQPYGFPVHTPHLQAFAAEAVLFRKAFCTAPTCGPSRASMLTGRYPHQNGVVGLPGPQGWRIDDYSTHLVRFLGRHGYETILAGCQHETDKLDLTPLGYDRVLNAEQPPHPLGGQWYPDTINRVEAFLATRRSDRPFFLSVGIDEPHRDNIPRPELNLHGAGDRFAKTRYYDPAKLDARYTAPPPWLPDLPEIRRDMASYAQGVRIMDEYMGRVLTALAHTGLDADTLVIVTSDHGIEFPGGKKSLSDQGTQVMLMLRGPEGTGLTGGRVIEPMVSQLDLYPTICSLIGAQPGHQLEGRDLLPLVRGEVDKLHDAVFAEQTWHGQLEPLRSVRTERYKYVRRHLPIGPKLRSDGPTSPVMEALGWFDRPLGHEELYDLYLDPWEAHNRIDDPALRDLRADLTARLDRWMHDTGDFFPRGAFPDPPGRPPQLAALSKDGR
jgi:N-sulfoglucosamine sulfohydrolase